MSKAEELLHAAVCQAVAILNIEPELVVTASGRRVRDILRTALADYANAVMDEPAKPAEVAHMKKVHGHTKRGVAPYERATLPPPFGAADLLLVPLLRGLLDQDKLGNRWCTGDVDIVRRAIAEIERMRSNAGGPIG